MARDESPIIMAGRVVGVTIPASSVSTWNRERTIEGKSGEGTSKTTRVPGKNYREGRREEYRLRQAYQPVRQGKFDQFNGAVEIQLLHQLGLVELDGPMRNAQFRGDIFC